MTFLAFVVVVIFRLVSPTGYFAALVLAHAAVILKVVDHVLTLTAVHRDVALFLGLVLEISRRSQIGLMMTYVAVVFVVIIRLLILMN